VLLEALSAVLAVGRGGIELDPAGPAGGWDQSTGCPPRGGGHLAIAVADAIPAAAARVTRQVRWQARDVARWPLRRCGQGAGQSLGDRAHSLTGHRNHSFGPDRRG